MLGKVFQRSLLRSTWQIFDAGEQELAVATERSASLAILRRVLEAIPYARLHPDRLPLHDRRATAATSAT